jgi:coenzyme F420-0:L-glutamate ligase/coenzyme F420-1:gamma-L-glutamate ligase
MTGRLEVLAPSGVAEVVAGDDLAALLLGCTSVQDGDVVTVTSKVVSKAEGRQRTGDREASVDGETVRVVARRGPTRIVRTRHGLTLAAAGVDASNVAAGHHLLLPGDPDGSARRLREAVLERAGANVAVVVTDTAGRAWRTGQTDIAIGAAGLVVLEDLAGERDAHGNELAVTAPAVADELASAAELASGKLGGRPFTVIRGRADLVLPAGRHGAGAAALVRPDAQDMFGLGAREAVVAALARRDGAGFGAPAAPADLAAAVRTILGPHARIVVEDDAVIAGGFPTGAEAALDTVAFAFGWACRRAGGGSGPGIEVRFLPGLP